MRRAVPWLAGLGAVALVVALVVVFSGGSTKKVTAVFPQTIGLYPGSSVRILGVPVGKVTKIKTQGTSVRVDMEYDAKYKLPADVAAAIVPPSIVADRYVQLTPVYQSGPVLPDKATIPEDRTEVPVELDQIFSSINDLNVALGPHGANKQGALSRLVNVGAANLAGNGQALHDALTGLGNVVSTLSNNRTDLFSTITNLQQFTSTLANDDQGVRRVSSDLAQVSVQLNDERQELGAALKDLSIALGQVATFVHDNRAALTKDVSDLGSVTSAMVTEKRAIEEVLDDSGLALVNLALAYDPNTQTLRTRDNSASARPGQSPGDPTGLICQLLVQLGQKCPSGGLALPTPAATTHQSAAQSLADLLAVS